MKFAARIFLVGLILLITLIIKAVFPSLALAASIRVSGFTTPRAYAALVDPSGNPGVEWEMQVGAKLINALKNPANFGSGGIVPCGIEFLPFVTLVNTGSLVDGSGNKKMEVFFAGAISSDLGTSEAQELARFIRAGGIVYLNGARIWGETEEDDRYSGPTFNPLFEALGVGDRFTTDLDERWFMGGSSVPAETRITNGKFGRVGDLEHGEFMVLNSVSLQPVTLGFETLGGVVTFIATSYSTNDPLNVLVAEGSFGNGYLVVSGTYLYANFYTDPDNLKYFLNLFALGCSQSTSGKQLNVPMFKQGDTAWGNQIYDSADQQNIGCGTKIKQCGCAMSSIAMVLKYFGINKDPFGNPTTPESVNNYFKRGEMCDSKSNLCTSLGYWHGNVIWSAADKYSADANKIYSTQKVLFTGYKKYFDSNFVVGEINADKPVILNVPGKDHWVVATGINGTTFNINDPGYNRPTLNDSAYNNTALAMREYQKTSSDFSRFEVASLAPVQILVTDQEGRKTGFDEISNTIKEEIPDSTYVFEPSYADATEENPIPPSTSGIYIVSISTPTQQEFSVKVVNQNDDYSFTVHASDRDADLDFNIFEGNANNPPYVFSYNPVPSGDPLIQKVDIDINGSVEVNKTGKGFSEVKVIIFSSDVFDATSQIDRTSLSFGPTGGEFLDYKFNNVSRDANKDGKNDLMVHFKIPKGSLEEGNQTFILKGKTKNGVMFEGSNLIVVR